MNHAPTDYIAGLDKIVDRECAYLDFDTRRERIYREEFTATMQGCGDFWPTGSDWKTDAPEYDNEQYLEVFRAVQVAMQNPGSDVDRWRILMKRIQQMAHDFADGKARGEF